MYLPPNSFSIRLPDDHQRMPGGDLRVDVQQDVQPGHEEAERQRHQRDQRDDELRPADDRGHIAAQHGQRFSTSERMQRLAGVALGGEVAGQHHPPRPRLVVAQIEKHLSARRDHHRAQRVGRDRVDQPVVLLIAAIRERREPLRDRVADLLLDLPGDEAGLARQLEVVAHDADPAVERDVAHELHLHDGVRRADGGRTPAGRRAGRNTAGRAPARRSAPASACRRARRWWRR